MLKHCSLFIAGTKLTFMTLLKRDDDGKTPVSFSLMPARQPRHTGTIRVSPFYSGATDARTEAVRATVSFLSAAAEEYASHMGADDSEEANGGFPMGIAEWAYGISDELSMLACDIEEGGLVAVV